MYNPFCVIVLFCVLFVCKCVLDNRHIGHFLTTLTEVFPCISSVVRQMPGYNSRRRGTARTSQFTSQLFPCNCSFFLCKCFFFFSIFICVPSYVFCVLFVCKCVPYCRHRVSTKLQLNNNNHHHQSQFYKSLFSVGTI
jgi:hypothetical protein